MRLIPSQKNLLVRREDPKAVSEGGVILPDQAQEMKSYGTVIEAGPLAKPIAPGTRIMFGNYAGTPITDIDDFDYPEGSYVLVSSEDVMATIHD